MPVTAQDRGYAYIALTDHSQRLTVAHGLDAAKLSRQIDEIDKLNGKLSGFTVLKGMEVDILADGHLDMANDVLSRLDIVVAAIHYKFDLSRDKQTERIIRAMDNRHVSILAHPTGRLIGERDPYDVDMERIMMAAHERGCLLELNAQPDRLGLTDAHAQAANPWASSWRSRPMPIRRPGLPICVTVSIRHDAVGSSLTMSSIRGHCRS